MVTVLFICHHDAGRSQIAAALFNRLADGRRARAISAGLDPAPFVHPEVVLALLDVDIDLFEAHPRKLEREMARGCAVVVTFGCDPKIEGVHREDWTVDDPKGKSIDEVSVIRDAIQRRVVALLEERGWLRAR